MVVVLVEVLPSLRDQRRVLIRPAVLPQPTFNLGELGFSNGGWNPEGLQYTNRPQTSDAGRTTQRLGAQGYVRKVQESRIQERIRSHLN